MPTSTDRLTGGAGILSGCRNLSETKKQRGKERMAQKTVHNRGEGKLRSGAYWGYPECKIAQPDELSEGN